MSNNIVLSRDKAEEPSISLPAHDSRKPNWGRVGVGITNSGMPVLNAEYSKYEVDSRRCTLEVCDSVTPETLMGWHYASGQPVVAGIYGQVATIYYNPMHDSLMITVTTTMFKRDENATAGF
jgi:hypothetical protein